MSLKCLIPILALGFYFPLGSYIGVQSASPVARSRNGVRIIGGSGSRGRLEVSTLDPLFPGTSYGTKTIWLPVCSEGFTEVTAQSMCQLLGYTAGRINSTSAGANSTTSSGGYSARFLNCRPMTPSGRQLRGSGSMPARVDTDGRAVARRSLSYRGYTVAVPSRTQMICTFFMGFCYPSGPIAEIECSDSPFPVPPPRLPSPIPPPYADFIRIVGPWRSRSVERNLCPTSPTFCEMFARMELRVPALNGTGDVWAPVCAVESEALRLTVARVACQQAYGWPDLAPMPTTLVFSSTPVQEPFVFMVPTEPVVNASSDAFDPATRSAWVTILDHPGTEPSLLQDGNMTISTTPCTNLIAVSCQVLLARRR